MPLSKKRNRERMRAVRAKKKVKGTALLPKSLVKKMLRVGINPERYVTLPETTLDDYRDLKRQLEAKVQRVEWQSGGIAMLRNEVVTLRALLDTRPAMSDGAILQRLTQVEAEQALHEAQHQPQAAQETNLPALSGVREVRARYRAREG